MDVTRLGEVAAALMDHLAEDEAEGELGEVMILAEVRYEDAEIPTTGIAYRCSDARDWVQRGMLHAALDSDRIPEEENDSE